MKKFQSGLAALAIFCLSIVDAAAQTVPDFIPEQPNAEPGLSAIANSSFTSVEQDIVAGQFERARATLLGALADEPNSFQARFLLAEVERRIGNFQAAIEIYRSLLVENPALDRVRLELAVTLIAAGDDADAQDELFVVLINTPPGVVAARIRNVMGAIEQRKTFVWDAGISLVGDSNANAAPRDRTVTIFGLPFVLSDESRQRSGVGGSASAGAEWRPALTNDLRLRIGGSLFAVDYQGRAFDLDGANTQVGLQTLHERWNASVLAVGSARDYDGEPYSSSYGLRTEGVWSPVERVAILLAGDLQYASYSTLGVIDGNQWSISTMPVYAFRPDLAGWINLSYAERDSRASVFAYGSQRFGLGGRYDTDWGLTVSAEADAILYQYKAPNPFFAMTQRDTLAWGYVAVTAPRLSALGLFPRVAVTYSNNFSNIPIYRYDRTNIEFSFVRRY